jgi:hypothetical protein
MSTLAPEVAADADRHHPLASQLVDTLGLAWTYDPVYYAMEASLDEEEVPRVAEALGAVLSEQLDAAGAKGQLSQATRDLVSWSGGLQRRQQLFFTPPGVTTLFAVLWPWTEDSGCTVRLGLFYADGGIADREPLAALLRSWVER